MSSLIHFLMFQAAAARARFSPAPSAPLRKHLAMRWSFFRWPMTGSMAARLPLRFRCFLRRQALTEQMFQFLLEKLSGFYGSGLRLHRLDQFFGVEAGLWIDYDNNLELHQVDYQVDANF